MADDPKRTMFAQRALTLAELFQGTFANVPIGKEVKYRAELVAPDGPSTGGGTQSLQAIKLTPIQTGTTIVIGHANQVERTAELRTYEYLVRWQQQRFKGVGELVLEREAYEDLFQRLKTFFGTQQMRINVVAAPAGASPEAAFPAGSRMNVWMVVAGVAVGLAVLVGLLYWLRH
jgi:hypothetical protein